jgi:hypothetical protein
LCRTQVPLLRDNLESLSCRGELGLLAGDLLEAAHDLVAIGRIELDQPGRPVLWAAINVLPEPAKRSSTISLRLEQSLMASATSATG